jgi:hypothetical protein
VTDTVTKLVQLLRDDRDGIVQGWLESALAAYPQRAAAVFTRRRNRFANPVGHGLRAGLNGLFAALLDGMDPDEIRGQLDGIIRVRAVQQLEAAEAVGFVFRLKDVIRARLPAANGNAALAADLAQLERRIDEIALAAFEIYTGCREQVCELRINEVKRQLPWVMERQSR